MPEPLKVTSRVETSLWQFDLEPNTFFQFRIKTVTDVEQYAVYEVWLTEDGKLILHGETEAQFQTWDKYEKALRENE